MGHGFGFKRGFLPDQSGDQHGIDLIARRLAAQVDSYGSGNAARQASFGMSAMRRASSCGNGLAYGGHSGAVMPRGDRGARGIDQEFWRARRGVGGAIFQFRRGIERNIAERAGAGLPLHRGRRKRRLVESREDVSGAGRNHRKQIRRDSPAKNRCHPARAGSVRRPSLQNKSAESDWRRPDKNSRARSIFPERS